MDLVDTDVLIDVQRGHPPALAWFAGLTVLPAVQGFVVMELVQDASQSTGGSPRIETCGALANRLADNGGLHSGVV
jgi:hypothetical protein